MKLRPNLLLVTILLLSISSMAQKKVNMVFIGNSITQGALITNPEINAPPAVVAQILTDKGFELRFANHGAGGSTTVDHLPQTGTLFVKTKESADKFAVEDGQLIFSIMLGTNDSAISGPNGSPVSKSQYMANIQTITNELIRLYPSCRIVIHYPVWYSLNTYNSAAYLRAGLERLVSYREMIDRVVAAQDRIYLGDTSAFAFFEQNHLEYYFAEDGQAGTFYLHPNAEGAKRLAGFWSDAILKVLKE